MKIILLSFSMLTIGVVLAFLMVIHLLTPSFVLGFLAYAASLGGLMLGTSAVIQHGGPSTSLRTGHRRREWD